MRVIGLGLQEHQEPLDDAGAAVAVDVDKVLVAVDVYDYLIDDFLVVDFTSVYSVHFDTLATIAQENDSRLTLLSPYKEHLAQAFARFFMRVGLPADIPKFSKRVKY